MRCGFNAGFGACHNCYGEFDGDFIPARDLKYSENCPHCGEQWKLIDNAIPGSEAEIDGRFKVRLLLESGEGSPDIRISYND